MTNKRSTKRALIASVISLLLCFTMLLGTTYAWFTDSVESKNNVIKTGNLDVEFEYYDGKEWKDVHGSSEILDANALWEPGYTDVVYLRLKNAGSLALKYQLGVNIVSETEGVNVEGDPFLLSDYIYFDVVEGVDGETNAYATREDAMAVATEKTLISKGYSKAGALEAGSDYVYLAMVVYMPTTVGNVANHNGKNVPEINLGINVMAYQFTNEHDAFGNDYDAMAGGYYHVEYTFSNPADLLAFAPTAGDAASSGLSITADGKAQIDASGAWYTVNANLAEHEYIVEYDIDITDVAVGENVTVDTGETAGWGSTPIMLERGSTKVYYGLSKNEYLGELEGTVVHVSHTYKYNADSKLEITSTVSDGVDTVMYTKAVASAAENELYWDIYYATDASKATMDNFSVKSADAVVDSPAELNSVLAEGGKVVLSTDIKASTSLIIPEGVEVELDLNGKTVTGSSTKDAGAVLVNNGSLTVVGGTMTNTTVNGGAVVENKGSMTLDDVTVKGSAIAEGGYPEYAVLTTGKLTVEDGTTILAERGAISTENKNDENYDYSTTELVINGGSVMVSDAADGLGLTLHTIYAFGYGTVVTINGGYFEMAYSANSGSSVICPAGASITVNDGTFNYSGEADYQGGIFQNYMGYDVPLNVRGGTYYDATVKQNLAEGYQAVDNLDGTYVVLPALENGATLSAVSGYEGLYTDGTNYYVYDAEGLISMRNFWKANWTGNDMWGRSYNVMADIDATGYTWENVWVNVGSNENNGFVFDGHGKTITGLTIKDGMFSGTPNGGNKPENPGYMQNITFDGVTVVGDHWAGVLWSNVYNELVVENVTVKNSTITGACNVAALVGGTVIDGAPDDASVKFIKCVVENNIITANGKDGQDPNGASVYLSRAYGNTSVSFENCVASGNTVTNNNGLVGGGIYGYTTWANGGFTGTGKCDTFTNWNGISVATAGTTLSEALNNEASNVVLPAGEYTMVSTSGDKVISGTKDTVITVSGTPEGSNVTFNGVTVKGSGYASGVNVDTVTYNNATIVGEMCLYREKVVFNNCDFTLAKGQYIWTYGANNVEFNNCTFNTVGKAILIYNEGDGAASVSVKGCTFNATEGDKAGDITNQNCAAIEINNYQKNGSGTNYTLTTEGNTYDSNFSGEWRIKNYMAPGVVTVNGVEYTKTALEASL